MKFVTSLRTTILGVCRPKHVLQRKTSRMRNRRKRPVVSDFFLVASRRWRSAGTLISNRVERVLREIVLLSDIILLQVGYIRDSRCQSKSFSLYLCFIVCFLFCCVVVICVFCHALAVCPVSVFVTSSSTFVFSDVAACGSASKKRTKGVSDLRLR